MSLEIDSLTDIEISKYAFWTLKTGLWDGRPITREEIPAFRSELEAKIQQFLFSYDPDSIDFQRMAATFAWIGSRGQERILLAKEIEELRLDSNGIVLAKHKHKKESFYERHKVGIWVGIAIVAVVSAVAISIFSGGTAGGAAGTLAGEALNELNDALGEKTPSKRSSTDNRAPYPQSCPRPIDVPTPESLALGEISVVQ